MRNTKLAATFVLAASTATSAGAVEPAFLEATSELDDGKPATSMWNAADGKDSTVWCTKANPDHEALNFTFADPVVVTHLGIIVAPKKGDGIDKSHRRPRVVVVSDVEHQVEAKFKDMADLQVLELTPPAKGKRIVVEFPETSPGEKADAPLCVAEVVLRSKGKDLTGTALANKVRALNTPQKRLLHTWHDDLSAPSRTLQFDVDGSFTYSYAPLLDGDKPVKLKGKWSATGTNVTFDVGGKSFSVAHRLTKVDEGGTETVELTFEGDGPTPSLTSTYRPAPLLLP